MFTAAEVKQVALFARSFGSLLATAKVFLRTIWSWVSRAKLLCMGQALVAPLRLSLRDRGVPVWLNTRVKQLIVEDGRVVGVAAEREGRPIKIRANRGVVLAAGGFAHNKEMREKYQRSPISAEWTWPAPAIPGMRSAWASSSVRRST